MVSSQAALRLPEILRTPERAELRRVVRAFLNEQLPDERVGELDRAGEFARDTWTQLADIGVHGLGIPEALGGSGGSPGDALLVTMEMAHRFPSLAADWLLVPMAAELLVAQADDRQREQWLPALIEGREIFSFGLSEPAGGTDILAGRTTAELQDDTWLIRGQKLWTSMAAEASWIFTLARTEPEPAGGGSRARQFSLIAVPLPQPDVVINRIELSGMRSTGVCEVFFDDAVAPAENIIGERGRGFHLLRSPLAVERILSAGVSLGLATAAFELALRYCAEREAFGRPIGAYQAVQHPLVDSAVELAGSLLLAERTVEVLESGSDATGLAAMAKISAAETAARVVDRGMRALAAHGYATSSRMQMFFRDARLQTFSPISNEMIRNMLAEQLGLPRSY